MKNTDKTETGLHKHNYLKHIVIINKKNNTFQLKTLSFCLSLYYLLITLKPTLGSFFVVDLVFTHKITSSGFFEKHLLVLSRHFPREQSVCLCHQDC